MLSLWNKLKTDRWVAETIAFSVFDLLPLVAGYVLLDTQGILIAGFAGITITLDRLYLLTREKYRRSVDKHEND